MTKSSGSLASGVLWVGRAIKARRASRTDGPGGARHRHPVPSTALAGHGPRTAIGVAAVLVAMALVVLDAAMVNVALPAIARSLRVDPGAGVWVIAAYQAAIVMALFPCAALGDRLGPRRVFTGGTGLFVSAALLCAACPSLPWLVVARVLQGFGAAAVMALGVALLRDTMPATRVGAAIGWNAMAVALASAAGPAVGTAIQSVAGWRWVFAVDVPLGALALCAAPALPARPGTGRPLDLMSIGLNATGFAAWVWAADQLSTRPLWALLGWGLAAVAFRVLVSREASSARPLIPIDLLRAKALRVSAGASVLCFVGVSAAMIALPFHLQPGLGLSPAKAGLCLVCWPLTVALAGPLAGRLADDVPGGWLCAAGGALMAAGLGALSLLPAGSPVWTVMPAMMVCGLGFGLFNVSNNRSLFLSAPDGRSAAAGGLQATARLMGQTVGALGMALLFRGMAVEGAARTGLAVASALTLAAGVASTLRTGTPRIGPGPKPAPSGPLPL